VRREPRIIIPRRSMAHRLTHEPPDDPWTDVTVIAVAMILLFLCCALASVVPAR
jgi:hypothetical protein